MNKLIAGFFVAFSLALPCTGFATSISILESATLGPTGVPGSLSGYVVADIQYVGARFHVSQPVELDHIGGVLGNINFNDSHEVFGAIAAISGSNGFPASGPLTFQPIAVTTFVPPFLTADLSIPLSVMLMAGDYALIFGGGRFGATGGEASLPTTNTDTAQASYFFGLRETNQWGNNSIAHNMRFTVTGTLVPEPSSLVLAALGVVSFAAWGRRRKQ